MNPTHIGEYLLLTPDSMWKNDLLRDDFTWKNSPLRTQLHVENVALGNQIHVEKTSLWGQTHVENASLSGQMHVENASLGSRFMWKNCRCHPELRTHAAPRSWSIERPSERVHGTPQDLELRTAEPTEGTYLQGARTENEGLLQLLERAPLPSSFRNFASPAASFLGSFFPPCRRR